MNQTFLKCVCLRNKGAMARHVVYPVLSPPHLADPTLTSDNFLEVMKDKRQCWKDLADELDILEDSMHGMEDVVDEYVQCYPTPSWKKIALALQEMKLCKLADEVTTKYVRGINITCASELAMVLG